MDDSRNTASPGRRDTSRKSAADQYTSPALHLKSQLLSPFLCHSQALPVQLCRSSRLRWPPPRRARQLRRRHPKRRRSHQALLRRAFRVHRILRRAVLIRAFRQAPLPSSRVFRPASRRWRLRPATLPETWARACDSLRSQHYLSAFWSRRRTDRALESDQPGTPHWTRPSWRENSFDRYPSL